VLLLLPASLTGIEWLRKVAAGVRSDFIRLIPDIRTTLEAGRVRRLTRNDFVASSKSRSQES
jgi:hypothetical protein